MTTKSRKRPDLQFKQTTAIWRQSEWWVLIAVAATLSITLS